MENIIFITRPSRSRGAVPAADPFQSHPTNEAKHRPHHSLSSTSHKVQRVLQSSLGSGPWPRGTSAPHWVLNVTVTQAPVPQPPPHPMRWQPAADPVSQPHHCITRHPVWLHPNKVLAHPDPPHARHHTTSPHTPDSHCWCPPKTRASHFSYFSGDLL